MNSLIFQNHSIKNFPLFCHFSPPPTGACIATSAPCCQRHCLMDSVTNAFADRRRRRRCCRCRRRLTDHYKCSLSRGRDMTEPSERESTKANYRKKDIQRKFRIVCRLLQVAVCQFFWCRCWLFLQKPLMDFDMHNTAATQTHTNTQIETHISIKMMAVATLHSPLHCQWQVATLCHRLKLPRHAACAR